MTDSPSHGQGTHCMKTSEYRQVRSNGAEDSKLRVIIISHTVEWFPEPQNLI